MVKLTAKQERFVEEYLVDLNATQAAIRAGYSPDSAGTIAGENMKKPQIRACIDTAIAKLSTRTGVNQERVIRELAKVAFVNAADVIDFDTATIASGASREDTAAIASIKVKTIPTADGEGVEREIKVLCWNTPASKRRQRLGAELERARHIRHHMGAVGGHFFLCADVRPIGANMGRAGRDSLDVDGLECVLFLQASIWINGQRRVANEH